MPSQQDISTFLDLIKAKAEIETKIQEFFDIDKYQQALRDVLSEYDKHICEHTSLKRGGSIWTICEDCGRKWADDQGGYKAHLENPKIAAARALL